MIDLQKVAIRKEHVINLKKTKGISNQKAQVVLSLDYSGSMSELYKSVIVQDTIERILPLGLAFDDNEEVDFYLFESSVRKIPENIKLNNLDGFINEKIINKYNMGGTNYAPVINMIVNDFKSTETKKRLFKTTIIDSDKPLDYPVYVIFITDGQNSDEYEAKKAIREASKHGIFFQFVGIGDAKLSFLEELDNLDGRVIDNANFFQIKDLKAMSDDNLYSKLMGEFPDWINLSRNKGQIK
jgi:hypothetical protein